MKKVPARDEVVANTRKPAARSVSLEPRNFDRQPGRLKGLIEMRDNFDDPLPPEIAAAFAMEPSSA